MCTVMLMFVMGMVLLILDYRKSGVEITEGISRNTYGQGGRTETLQVEAQGEETADIEVEVSERAYNSAELAELFERTIRRLDKLILGKNESPDRIEQNMNLLTEIPGEPIDVSWELDHYDVMNVNGELNEKNLTEEGTMVTLRAVLTYRERESEQALYECSVMVYPKTLSKNEQFIQKVQEKILESNASSKTQETLELPEEIEGKELHFYPVMDTRGIVIMVMAVLIFVLLYALEKQNEGQELEKRRRQMRLDYPEIVSKLTLLLGAGMTVRRAWEKIVEDYVRKESSKTRYAYEEMKVTCREMKSGIAESESYERFGKRCGLQEYIRLGALLSQNLRKGMKGLNDLLKLEAAQAFEERKLRAKRLGEEAGTKLLMPMFLMLAVVLVIVVVPAFLSIQL